MQTFFQYRSRGQCLRSSHGPQEVRFGLNSPLFVAALLALLLLVGLGLARGDTPTATYFAPDTRLTPAALAFINSASGSVYVGANSFSDSSVALALCRAETRGCTVRAVLDVTAGTANVRGGYVLASSGATVIAARFPDRIENHFVTSAGSRTMTGNYYWSPTAVQVGNYLTMISGTSTATSAATTYAALAASGTPFLSYSGSLAPQAAPPPQVFFSPNGGCQAALCKAIDEACTSVFVTSYEMTNPAIAGALLNAKGRGVTVAVVCDARNYSMKNSQLFRLHLAGIPIYLDFVDKIMHSKYLIIDSNTVITGSYNFTMPAEGANAENLLILSEASVTWAYANDWNNLKAKSRPIAPDPPSQSLCPGGKCPNLPSSSRSTGRRWRSP